jgi:Glycosyl transferase family 2
MKGPADSTPQRIALVMIARDEARAIERCLNSVRPWVDDMIVLDTGSRDATAQIAQRCGARVFHFDWVDDFSAARNAALAHAQAEWRLVLDADEWLIDGAHHVAALRAQAPTFVGQISVASLLDAAGTEAPSWLPRILPRGALYSGRIHEQPDCAVPRRRLDVSIGHDGYLPAQRAAKAGRNRRLLERALADHPDDAYISYQLGKDFEVHEQFADAAPHYRRAHAATHCGASATAPWRHDLVIRLLFTLKRLGALDEAVRLVDAESAHWLDSPDFHFTLGDLWLECAIARPQFAAPWLPRIEASWLRALEIGEQPHRPDTVRGRGSFLAAHNLAVFHRSLGQAAKAQYWEHAAADMRHAAGSPRGAELAGSGRDIPALASAPLP